MVKSKYSPERVERILEAVALDGGDRAGWEAGEINPDTFYEWLKRYPDFSEGVAQAKREYRESLPRVQVRQAKTSVADYLFGRVIETWTTHETITEGDKVIVKDSVKTVQRGVPQWVVDRVLGKNLNVIDALQVLLLEGVATEAQAKILHEGVERIQEELKALSKHGISQSKEACGALPPVGKPEAEE